MTDLPDHRLKPNRGDANILAGGDVNGVTVVKEVFGVVLLGVISILLLIALLRAQARNRELLERLEPRERPM